MHCDRPIFFLRFASRSCLCSVSVVLLTLATNWRLDFNDDIVGVSILRRYGIYLRVDSLILFVSSDSLLVSVKLSGLGSSSVSGSFPLEGRNCEEVLTADGPAILFVREHLLPAVLRYEYRATHLGVFQQLSWRSFKILAPRCWDGLSLPRDLFYTICCLPPTA